jgi:hypothetical protein
MPRKGVGSGVDVKGGDAVNDSPVAQRDAGGFSPSMIRMPSGKEMLVLAAVGWSTAIVFAVAAFRLGGGMRIAALVWGLAVLVWTIVAVLRLVGGRDRE